MHGSIASTDVQISMSSRLTGVGKIFWDPWAVYEQESQRPNAFVPFAVFTLTMIALLIVLSTPVMNVALSSVPEAVRAEASGQVASMMETNRWISILSTPLLQGIRVIVIGTVIYCVGSLAGTGDTSREGDFHRALSIAAYASFALLAEEATNAAVVWIMGWENVRHVWDLRPVLGMHYFVEDPSSQRVAFAALQQVNPFAVMYGGLMALGIRRVFATSWATAWLTSAAVIACGVAFVSLVASFRG